MNPREIEKFIQQLEDEVRISKKDAGLAESLDRLKWIAATYRGDDEVIASLVASGRIKLNADELKMFSGWSGVDELINGFRLQQLIVVSAITKSGKTSWLMDLTTRLKEYAPLWFPFEESAEELIRKYLERGEEPPLFYFPLTMRGGTMQWVEMKIIEAIAKYDSKVIVIDHLDFVVPFTADNHALRVGQAMRDLKALAKKWNVAIFVVCHLTKVRMDTEPTLEDLRGSSSIGQEADTVILLWREMRRESGHVVITNNVNLSVQANRRTGRTGNVKMVYENGKFFEREWITRDEEEAAAEAAFNTF